MGWSGEIPFGREWRRQRYTLPISPAPVMFCSSSHLLIFFNYFYLLFYYLTMHFNKYVKDVENRDTCKERIMIPVGLIQDKTDKFCVKNGAGRQTQKVSYRQHAVDLAFAITVWKSQRGTFKKALVLLEGSHDAAKWCFEHLYMAYSRMPIETCFSCFPLSSSRILDSDNSIIVCLNDCFYIRGRYMWTSWRESLYT